MSLYNLEIKLTELLKNEETLKPLLTGVYSYVPKETKLPYVVFSNEEATRFEAKGFKGKECSVTIFIFDEARSSLKVKHIIETIEDVLLTSFSINGWYFEHYETTRIAVDRDDELTTGQIDLKFRCIKED
jgi:hypothetical protein